MHQFPLPFLLLMSVTLAVSVKNQVYTDLKEVNLAILGGTAGATSVWSNREDHNVDKAFVVDPKIGWCSENMRNGPTQTIWKQFKQPVKLFMITFQGRRDVNLDEPTRFDIIGSNNEDCSQRHQDNWVTLATDDSGDEMSIQDKKTIRIPAGMTRYFTCYGIRVRDVRVRSNSDKFACISHIKFYMDSELVISKDHFMYLKEVNLAKLGGTAGATSIWSNSENVNADKAFVVGPGIGWCSQSMRNGPPQTIWKQFKQPVKLFKITFQGRRDVNWDEPTKFDIIGSNNEDCTQDNWVTLATDDSGDEMSIQDKKTIHIPAGMARYFTCYGIRVRDVRVRSNGDKYACISHIKLYMDSDDTTPSPLTCPLATCPPVDKYGDIEEELQTIDENQYSTHSKLDFLIKHLGDIEERIQNLEVELQSINHNQNSTHSNLDFLVEYLGNIEEELQIINYNQKSTHAKLHFLTENLGEDVKNDGKNSYGDHHGY